ncbi:MAG TPA: hypothetical protein VFY59_07395 [Rubrobacter sp.]|nr:hypothetical protein [Rubrobacter sp.]
MHGLAEYEFLQDRYTQMRREAEMARLAKLARPNRKVQPDLVRPLRWELSRYVGLLAKRLGNNA